MKLVAWSENQDIYKLSDEFTIEKADAQQYAIYLATYDADNVEGVLNWDERVLFSNPGNNGYWIKKGGKRIGGVGIGPNFMNSFFIEPPFMDSYEVLKLLKNLLIKWSDRSKKIMLWGLPSYYEDFSKLGFWKHMTRCCMIRPTEKFNITLDNKYLEMRPKNGDEKNMAEISYLARVNSLESIYNQVIYGDSIKIEDEVIQYKSNLEEIESNSILKKSSTCLYADNNELIAFCLISIHAKYPLIEDIVVHPNYQGKGLATYMLKKALSELKDDCPVLRLFVTIGLNAERIYHELGFQSGEKFTSFYIPEENFRTM
ncbi:GNAT family N-acetyltransferase [Paenibacillus sp. FA6]|uniref:GNAT family N-acetyltransferase n=1 Tax=Paenibacillus sp. FA6 TaxID=3413029 RepID=UPI003F660333